MLTRRSPRSPGWLPARRTLFLAFVLLTALILRVTDVNPAVAQSQSIVAWRVDESPDLDPDAPIWDEIQRMSVPLTSQQVTVPAGGGTVPSVRVSAAHHDRILYLNVEWTDNTLNEASGAPEEFTDAAAIQIPAEHGSSVPAVCMGQADGAVNIWQWRADRQKGLDQLGKGADFVDVYPSTDELFFPAQSAGNALATPGADVVQNLVASGFGTLEPASVGVVAGQGRFSDSQWRVVFARPFPAPDEFQPTFEEGLEFDVAFAVWDGHRGDRDGQKSVSSFVRLKVSDTTAGSFTAAGSEGGSSGWLILLSAGLVAFVAYAVVVLVIPKRERPEEESA